MANPQTIFATPRILPKHLEQWAPSVHPVTTTVRILGTITTISGDQATLTAPDDDAVTLILNRDSHLQPQSIYEVVGKVINLEGGHGLGLRVLTATEWKRNDKGQLPDMKLYEAVVEATHRHKDIFYAPAGVKEENGY